MKFVKLLHIDGVDIYIYQLLDGRYHVEYHSPDHDGEPIIYPNRKGLLYMLRKRFGPEELKGI